MKKIYLPVAVTLLSTMAFGQNFDKTLDLDFDLLTEEIIMPESPLDMDVLFVGGEDMVQTTATYGNPAGQTPAKQWHDFIGVTPIYNNNGDYTNEFWVTVNHERIEANDMIGDGGGMTVFKCNEDQNGQVSVVQNISLPDGRNGDFFNIDFANTVGETGMNCGGILAPNGRVWTAEEWFRSSNSSISDDGEGVRDTSDFTVTSDIAGTFNGATIEKYQNFNYMVEVDPKEGKAIRKQYNWGRLAFEGGAISKDMSTVYLGVDANPTFFWKFVANTPGDFTSGDLFVFKEDGTEKWMQVPNSSFEEAMSVTDSAIAWGATMYNRLEWVVMDTTTGMIYMTETGRDDIGARWADEAAEGATYAAHHLARNTEMGTIIDDSYTDYYGRVLRFDPATDQLTVAVEGGSSNGLYNNESSVGIHNYPEKHLSNPDGLSILYSDSRKYLVIQEDLNGNTWNRMPYGITNRTCELYLLDMSISNPDVSDLMRITAVPQGAEVTGAVSTPSGKALLINSQHPNSNELVNNAPFNNSLTAAIYGFDGLTVATKNADFEGTSNFKIYPNPVSREIHLNEKTDVAIYSTNGNRVKVARKTDVVQVSDLAPGAYVIVNKNKESLKFVIQ